MKSLYKHIAIEIFNADKTGKTDINDANTEAKKILNIQA